MTLIQGYLFRQIALPVAAACGALAGIGLLSQSLDQLELIVERGQSVWVMTKLTLLAMPQLLGVVLPIGLFVGAVIALTRLQREQEITAVFAAGMRRWSVIWPALAISAVVALLVLVSNVIVQPWSQRQARAEAFAVRTDLAALLVEEGRFVQGPDGLTVYVQQIEQNGLMRNLFVYVDNGKTITTWDADEARFGRVDGLPVLRMGHGSMQRYSSNGVLEFFSFDSNAFDLSPFANAEQKVRYKPSDLGVSGLFNPTPAALRDVGTREELLAEGHARLSSPLYAIAGMCLALTALMGGAFSRTGYGGRIAKASAAFLIARIAGYGLTAAGAWNPGLNPLQYVLPVAVALIALRLLFRQLKPRRTWAPLQRLKARFA